MRRNPFLIGYLSLLVASLAISAMPGRLRADQADTATSSTPDTTRVVLASDVSRIQGIDRPGRDKYQLARNTANILLFLPREATSGILYGVGRSAYVVSDPDFLDRMEAYLYFYKRSFGWYPTADIVSDNRPSLGAGLFYKDAGFKATLSGYRTSSTKWKSTLKLVYDADGSDKTVRTIVKGTSRGDDDRLFYGFGANPGSDYNNTLPISAEYGVYHQRLNRLLWSASLYDHQYITWQYLGFWQERQLADGVGDDRIGAVLGITDLAGFSSSRTQLYQEGSISFDTRRTMDELCEGFRVEGYSGYSLGLETSQPDFIRYGIDLFYAFPVLLENRILVPRIQVNGVELVSNEWAELPITDYPRHPLFRGVSNRKHLRTAKLVAVSSVEYQWPLTRLVLGSLFFDVLSSGDNFGEFRYTDAPYAFGTGIIYHTADQSVAQILLATGSEGFRLKFVLGFTLNTNDRADWD